MAVLSRNSRPKIDKDINSEATWMLLVPNRNEFFVSQKTRKSKVYMDVHFWRGGSGGSPAWTQKQQKPVFDREGKTPAQDTGCRNVSAGSSRKPERCPSFYVRVKWWARVLRFAKHRIAFFFLRRPWRKLLIGETSPSKSPPQKSPNYSVSFPYVLCYTSLSYEYGTFESWAGEGGQYD